MSPGTETLVIPEGAKVPGGMWNVVATNHRVNKCWEKLIQQVPENTIRCYEHLRYHPCQRYPGRVYPLKGKDYKGAWAYEVTGGDRVYYVPDLETNTVEVYYAGPHPLIAPKPK